MSRMFPISCHRRVLGIVAALLISSAAVPAADPVDQRVQDLLARMSIKEKAGQLVHYWRDKDGEPDAIPLAAGFRPPVRGKVSPREYFEFINGLQRQVIDGSPNRIPALIHDECLHGATAYARATSFPQSIALAASFDPELVGAVAAAIADEERSIGVRLVLAPVLNLSRDPRWGRTEETFGESPRLAADLGVAYVKPFRERGIATALKHFVSNYGDGGSDSAAVFIEPSELHNVWFKPFRAAVQQGGALAVMPCYNSVNGRPAHANPWLLTTVLRQGWGFDGIVVSDYNAWQIHGTHQLLPPGGPDPRLDDVLPCYRAGMDLPLHHSAGLMPRIAAAVQERRFPVAVLDAATGRILRTKALLGVLDQPFADPDQAEKVMHCAEHQKLAKRAAVAGSPVGLAPVESSVRAVLTTWYGGEAAGTALAEVLAGDAEPGGRLPITWPRHGGQIPIYHDLYPSGWGRIHYGDLESSPRFPFGFGLGYTTWTLSNLTVEAATVKSGEPIRLSVQVANTGKRAGSQVVQVYVAQRVAARVLPLQRLEAFRRVDLAAGEQRTITLELGPDNLGWYDADGVRHLDPGVVELRVGTSAGHLPIKASVTVGLADAGARKEHEGTL